MNEWHSGEELSLDYYQRLAAETDQTPVKAVGEWEDGYIVPLLGLVGEAGGLLAEFKKWRRDGDRYKPFLDKASEELGDLLWYLSNIATKLGLSLEEVARENLGKTGDRWGREDMSQALPGMAQNRYDEHFPAGEQLPTVVRAEFRMVKEDGRPKLEVSINGQGIGDRLTDNAHADDGYRFHDVFHLSCAILLGWSPITRALFKVKRRSDAMTDEVEDGARAGITEEGVAAVVYGFAEDYALFEGAERVEYELLRTIQMMVKKFEVASRTARDWERTILAAYAVWRQMIANNGGVFVGDANNGSVYYESL